LKRLFLAFLFFVSVRPFLFAQDLKIAVAANAQFVMKAIQEDYFKSTGKRLEVIIGSSGKLTAQIMHGAPYDLLLSADMQFPEKLYQLGFALSKPKVYALGSLIICSHSLAVDNSNWPQRLLESSVHKIAVANASLAPYGRAAKETLSRLNLLKKVESKLVYGESIAQVNSYIMTGAVQFGFTTEALVIAFRNKAKFYWTRIDPQLYAPIKQGMVLLKYAERHQIEAQRFYHYLLSEEAQHIFEKYGYRISTNN